MQEQYNAKINLLQDKDLFVGIDIGKTTHYISLMDSRCKDLLGKSQKIKNRQAGFEELLRIISQWDKSRILIGMEPTGHYWKAIAYWLKKRGYHIAIVNPYHVSRTSEVMFNSKGKTDAKDCLLICKMLTEGKFTNALLHDGVYADLRELSKTRRAVTQDLVRAKTRFRALFDEFMPEYGDCFSDLTCKTSLALLKKFDIQALKSAGSMDEKIEMIVRVSRGATGRTKAATIVNALANSIGVTEGMQGVQQRLIILIDQIELYQKQQATLELIMGEKLFQTEEAAFLLTMRGVGTITAAELLAETGSMRKFSNAKKIEKLAGIDLSEYSSGKHQGKRSFSKRGRDGLRHTLYRIVLVAIANDNAIRDIYLDKINVQKKEKMVAIGSLMVRVLKIIFCLVKNKCSYNEELVKNILAEK